MYKHWNPDLCQPRALVKWKDLLTGTWKGPDILLTQGRGYVCIFPQDADTPICTPDRLIWPYVSSPIAAASFPPEPAFSTAPQTTDISSVWN